MIGRDAEAMVLEDLIGHGLDAHVADRALLAAGRADRMMMRESLANLAERLPARRCLDDQRHLNGQMERQGDGRAVDEAVAGSPVHLVARRLADRFAELPFDFAALCSDAACWGGPSQGPPRDAVLFVNNPGHHSRPSHEVRSVGIPFIMLGQAPGSFLWDSVKRVTSRWLRDD